MRSVFLSKTDIYFISIYRTPHPITTKESNPFLAGDSINASALTYNVGDVV